VGFCFGGVLAYLFAATARIETPGGQRVRPDTAVSYYGSGVHGMLNLVDGIEDAPSMYMRPGNG
jgi:carboxymethylenebutenolidase